jgi:hypothetical protein
MCRALTPSADERRGLAETVYRRLARYGLSGRTGMTCAQEIVGTVVDDLRDHGLRDRDGEVDRLRRQLSVQVASYARVLRMFGDDEEGS